MTRAEAMHVALRDEVTACADRWRRAQMNGNPFAARRALRDVETAFLRLKVFERRLGGERVRALEAA